MRWPGRDVPWKSFLVALKREWTRDQVTDVAGALTFAGVLALFPFLVFLVALASLVIDPKMAESLVADLSTVAPPQVTQILGDRIRSLGAGGNPGLLTVGALGAIWAASGGMAALVRALNTAYDVEETRPFWKVRGLAVLTTLVIAAILLAAALIAVATPAVAGALGPVGAVLVWVRLPLAALLMMLVLALLYRYLPNTGQRFQLITPGAIAAVILWVVASWGFSLYVSNFGKYEASYGALGGVVVFLLWMWISSQVVLLGAEINSLLEQRKPLELAGTRAQRAVAPTAAVPLVPASVRSSPAFHKRKDSVPAWLGGVLAAVGLGFLGRRKAR
jgi:membrane protein